MAPHPAPAQTPDVDFPYGDLDAPSVVREGRSLSFTTIGDWVLLAPCKRPRAKVLYAILRMHINQQRGDKKAWPTRETLAELLDVKDTDAITDDIKWLVELGALDVEVVRWGPGRMRRRNVYTVHLLPPDGYQGPTSLQQWYAIHRADEPAPDKGREVSSAA